MGNAVVHFEIIGRDAARLHQFYGELFGWKIDANNPMDYGLVDTQSGEHAIGGGIGQSEEGARVTFYIEVPDVQSALDRVQEMGGRTVAPVTEVPGMVTFAQFADPEGNVVGLVKSGQP